MLSHLVAVTGGLRTAVHGVALVDRRQHLQTETSASRNVFSPTSPPAPPLASLHRSYFLLLVLADLLANLLLVLADDSETCEKVLLAVC